MLCDQERAHDIGFENKQIVFGGTAEQQEVLQQDGVSPEAQEAMTCRLCMLLLL